MSYDLNRKQARKIADQLAQKERFENVRVVTSCGGCSVKFDVTIDGYLARGAQIHRNTRNAPKTTGD